MNGDDEALILELFVNAYHLADVNPSGSKVWLHIGEEQNTHGTARLPVARKTCKFMNLKTLLHLLLALISTFVEDDDDDNDSIWIQHIRAAWC